MRSTRSLLLILLLAVPIAGWSQTREAVGSSSADNASYLAEFSILNTTNAPVSYEINWGGDAWKPVVLQKYKTVLHRHPLDSPTARIAVPVIRYKRLDGDGKEVSQEVRMEFAAVGSAGFSTGQGNSEPKLYAFKLASDGRSLDLLPAAPPPPPAPPVHR